MYVVLMFIYSFCRYVVVVDEEVNMVAHISKYIFKLDGTPNQIGHLKPFP
ncbi:unnamed protein product [Brassica napus]|uniref:(rape) hypothetical protein n=1 Tax=Brassica napus TaxID=3708 RepID=A0A816L5X0_BRANA|nr:unnamed protein product [Brassica napus]